MVAILEDVVQTAGEIDYTVLDELNSEQSDQAASLMSFLNSLELLCHQWKLIKKEKYQYRVLNQGKIDVYINELARSNKEGQLFNIQTFILSGKTPYMKTKNDQKVFINKEYSKGAGLLHLSFS